jgi:hypothetical protein
MKKITLIILFCFSSLAQASINSNLYENHTYNKKVVGVADYFKLELSQIEKQTEALQMKCKDESTDEGFYNCVKENENMLSNNRFKNVYPVIYAFFENSEKREHIKEKILTYYEDDRNKLIKYIKRNSSKNDLEENIIINLDLLYNYYSNLIELGYNYSLKHFAQDNVKALEVEQYYEEITQHMTKINED